MKVEYIYHSGFTLESEDHFFVFDYYMGDICLKDKKTIVFVTHKHHDHFNPIIFDWQRDNPNISYVVSSDLEIEAGKNIYKLEAYEILTLNSIEIKTFGSTDLGVSFLVKLDGRYIFHAGDLNWWHWGNDSLEEQLKEEEDFKREVSNIDKVDLALAFFPVDPRLGDGFYYGGKYFIEELRPRVFFPMHFGDRLEITKEFAEKSKRLDVRSMEISHKNQVFKFKDL